MAGDSWRKILLDKDLWSLSVPVALLNFGSATGHDFQVRGDRLQLQVRQLVAQARQVRFVLFHARLRLRSGRSQGESDWRILAHAPSGWQAKMFGVLLIVVQTRPRRLLEPEKPQNRICPLGPLEGP